MLVECSGAALLPQGLQRAVAGVATFRLEQLRRGSAAGRSDSVGLQAGPGLCGLGVAIVLRRALPVVTRIKATRTMGGCRIGARWNFVLLLTGHMLLDP